MSGQTEHEFVKAFVNILASQPVKFHDDFQEQPEKTLKKVPVVQVGIYRPNQLSPRIPAKRVDIQLEVPPPPELKNEEAHPSSGASRSLILNANCILIDPRCGVDLISARHNPNHIQVSQATVLHLHTRLTSRSHILHQEPNRRPTPRAPSPSAAAPSKRQSVGRCQTAKGVQRPRWRHDQPHGETRRRMGPRCQA